MKEVPSDGTYAKNHQTRFDKTMNFMSNLDLKTSKILNLGPDNPLSQLLVNDGYDITNTEINQDLDLEFEIVKETKYEAVMACEILEHMVSPFPVLKAIAAKKLLITVPLKLWFASAFWNDNDPMAQHYHEFEPKQIRLLLNKAGWTILQEEMHVSKSNKIGIRPILRRFTPRYYFAYCERK